MHTDYFEDIRTLYHECLQAVRDGDGPESWQRRLQRIQELRERSAGSEQRSVDLGLDTASG